jgi:hypothetical protein
VKEKIRNHINNKIKKIEEKFVPNKNHWNAGYNKGYYDALVYCLELLGTENIINDNLRRHDERL